MDITKNKLFWFAITMMINGIIVIFELLPDEKNIKLNFGDGNTYVGTIFLLIGIFTLFYVLRRKK
jgi:hypothetical protein